MFLFLDIRELVLEHNQMQMPEDFYELLDFCKSINSNDPKSKNLFLFHSNVFKNT